MLAASREYIHHLTPSHPCIYVDPKPQTLHLKLMALFDNFSWVTVLWVKVGRSGCRGLGFRKNM